MINGINRTMKNYSLILPDHHMQRMHVKGTDIQVYLLGMNYSDAKRLIKNAVILNRDGVRLQMIYGFDKNDKFKDIINNYHNGRIMKKEIGLSNPGVTYITMKSAYERV